MNADQIARIQEDAPAMLEFIKAVSENEGACTCDHQSWYGEGHAAGCVQGDAQNFLEAHK